MLESDYVSSMHNSWIFSITMWSPTLAPLCDNKIYRGITEENVFRKSVVYFRDIWKEEDISKIKKRPIASLQCITCYILCSDFMKLKTALALHMWGPFLARETEANYLNETSARKDYRIFLLRKTFLRILSEMFTVNQTYTITPFLKYANTSRKV